MCRTPRGCNEGSFRWVGGWGRGKYGVYFFALGSVVGDGRMRWVGWMNGGGSRYCKRRSGHASDIVGECTMVGCMINLLRVAGFYKGCEGCKIMWRRAFLSRLAGQGLKLCVRALFVAFKSIRSVSEGVA